MSLLLQCISLITFELRVMKRLVNNLIWWWSLATFEFQVIRDLVSSLPVWTQCLCCEQLSDEGTAVHALWSCCTPSITKSCLNIYTFQTTDWLKDWVQLEAKEDEQGRSTYEVVIKIMDEQIEFIMNSFLIPSARVQHNLLKGTELIKVQMEHSKKHFSKEYSNSSKSGLCTEAAQNAAIGSTFPIKGPIATKGNFSVINVNRSMLKWLRENWSLMLCPIRADKCIPGGKKGPRKLLWCMNYYCGFVLNTACLCFNLPTTPFCEKWSISALCWLTRITILH